jgi:hypothetical protein
MGVDFTTAWHASHDALYDLGMPIKKETRDAYSGTLETENAKGETIKISIDQELPKVPTEGPKTKVGVRVATFGDQELSKRILEQIATRAGVVPNATTEVTSAAPPAGRSAWKPPTTTNP